MNYFIVNREQLSRDGNTYELQGYQYGSTNISLILVDVPPGEGPKLHVHPVEWNNSRLIRGNIPEEVKKLIPPIGQMEDQPCA